MTTAQITQQGETTRFTDVIYRCGPDGSITPVSVQLQLKPGEEREDALFQACIDHTLQDTELQQFLVNSGLNLSSIAYVQSRGRGLHYDLTIRIPVRRIFKEFPNFPPYYRFLKIHIIHARYRADPKASTIVRPLITGNTTIYTDGHTVDAISFFGYTSWLGIISKRGFILRSGFSGYGIIKIS